MKPSLPKSTLLDRIAADVGAAGGRSSGAIAREHLGLGAVDEALAHTLVRGALESDPRFHYNDALWRVRETVAGYSTRRIALADLSVLVVYAPRDPPLAHGESWFSNRQKDGTPSVAIALRGTREISRYLERTESFGVAPPRQLSLTRTAALLFVLKSPCRSAEELAEALGVQHVAEDSPAGWCRALHAVWLHVIERLVERGIDTWEGLENAIEQSFEFADFESKRFGPGDLNALEEAPGVYVFRRNDGDALYVGQSSSLAGRVRSYFEGPPRDEKDREIRRVAHDLETHDCETPVDALFLEAALIARWKPELNTQADVHRPPARDGVLVLPIDGDRPRAAAFVVSNGRFRLRGTALASPRAARRLARRAVTAASCDDSQLLESRVDPESLLKASLIGGWLKRNPQSPFFELGIHGDAGQLEQLITRAILHTAER